MKDAFSQKNRAKVMALHLRPMTMSELAADPSACKTCRGVGHHEAPQDGFFRSLCPECEGAGTIC